MSQPTFIVHFTTIPPRFPHLSKTIASWLNQSVYIDRIVISVMGEYKYYLSKTKVEEYGPFDERVTIQTLDNEDSGPNIKIVGALLYYQQIIDPSSTYVIVCDDDIIYHPDTAKSYLEMIEKNNSMIYTHYVKENNPELPVVEQPIQGADSYCIPPVFFQKVRPDEYISFLTKSVEECPETFYQDDFVFSYYSTIQVGLQTKSVDNPKSYKCAHMIEELHFHPFVTQRLQRTLTYLSQKINQQYNLQEKPRPVETESVRFFKETTKETTKEIKKETKKETTQKGLIELVMIVKNSGDILRTCLRANKKYIDHWTILDTGSTDHTCDIIRSELKNIPGNLYQETIEPFDFSTARNRSLELAAKNCKYTIVLDDSYELHHGSELRSYLKDREDDVIHLSIGKYHKETNTLLESYYSHRIFKTSKQLRYRFRVHEELDYLRTEKSIFAPATIFVNDHVDKEQTKRSQGRSKQDIKWLLLDRQDYPNEPRLVYYLACLYSMGSISLSPKSVACFQELYQMTKNQPENTDYTFTAEFKLIMHEYDEKKDSTLYQKRLIALQKKSETRMEPSFKLAMSYYHERNIDKLDAIISHIVKVPTPIITATILDYQIYEYEIPFLYVISKLQLISSYTDREKQQREFEEVIPVFEKLVQRYPNDQKVLNIKYRLTGFKDTSSLTYKKSGTSGTILIHTGALPFTWNPDGTDRIISGSEQMAMKLAQEFAKKRYTVIILGSFLEKNSGEGNGDDDDDLFGSEYRITQPRVLNGVYYIDVKHYSTLCLTYVIDYLIVSRNADNIAYYNNAKKVYLWCHDVVPLGGKNLLEINTQKFKKMICISLYQKNATMNYYHCDDKYMTVSRNAIDPSRFQSTPSPVPRTPFRFMFSSSPDRGLIKFLEMTRTILSRYPTATFYAFVDLEKVTDEEKAIADANPGAIYLCQRVSQQQLALEMMSSDVWLYPTTFTETYCLSAVEAMAAGCLVATLSIGALLEIVGNRGIVSDSIDELFTELCSVLDAPKQKEKITTRAKTWALRQDFKSLADEWEDELFTL